MKTTGVLPEALAASISRFSRSEIGATPNPLRSGESQPDPIEMIESARGIRAMNTGLTGYRWFCGDPDANDAFRH
jgi:hypothetical protein